MQKFCLRNKRIKENQTLFSNSPPSVSFPRQPLKPYILYKKFIYEDSDLKHFKIRRPRHQNFQIDCSSSYFYIRNPYGIRRIIRHLKSIKHIQLYGLLFGHQLSLIDIHKLLRNLNRLPSISLYFGAVHFSQNGSEIYRIKTILENIQANLKTFTVEIYFGPSANIVLSEFIQAVIRAIQNMSHLTNFGMSLPKLGSKFGTVFQQQIGPSIQKDRFVDLSKARFQRLKKLEHIHIPFLIPNQPILNSFTTNFNHFNNIQSLEVVSPSVSFGKQLSKVLKNVKTLSSLTLYYWINPDDLICLLSELPNLKTLIFKEDWLFCVDVNTVFDDIMEQENYIEYLHFDFPMGVDDLEYSSLFSGFLSFFYNIKSMKMYICSEGSIAQLEPIAKAIGMLENLKDLTLGVFLRSGKVFHRFLKLMNNITRLERISLVMKLSFGSTWDQCSELTFKALENFFLKNKSLNQLELFWEKFSPNCMENLREIIFKLPVLKFFKLAYISVYKEHGQIHNEIMSILVKTLKEITKFEKIAVVTACPAFLYTGCEKKIRDIQKILKQVSFKTSTSIKTPFYNDILLF